MISGMSITKGWSIRVIRVQLYLGNRRDCILLFHQCLIEMKRTLMRLSHGLHIKEWHVLVWTISPGCFITGLIPGFRSIILTVIVLLTVISTKVPSISKDSGPR